MFRFDLGPLLQGQMRITKLKVLITHLLLVLEVCIVKPTFRKSWAGNLLMCLDLTLGPTLKVKQGTPNLEVLTTCLLLQNAVYLQNHGNCPFTVDTSCIWPQMRPWSS